MAKIEGRLITHNPPIIIEKSDFVTFYCYIFVFLMKFGEGGNNSKIKNWENSF